MELRRSVVMKLVQPRVVITFHEQSGRTKSQLEFFLTNLGSFDVTVEVHCTKMGCVVMQAQILLQKQKVDDLQVFTHRLIHSHRSYSQHSESVADRLCFGMTKQTRVYWADKALLTRQGIIEWEIAE